MLSHQRQQFTHRRRGVARHDANLAMLVDHLPGPGGLPYRGHERIYLLRLPGSGSSKKTGWA